MKVRLERTIGSITEAAEIEGAPFKVEECWGVVDRMFGAARKALDSPEEHSGVQSFVRTAVRRNGSDE